MGTVTHTGVHCIGYTHRHIDTPDRQRETQDHQAHRVTCRPTLTSEKNPETQGHTQSAFGRAWLAHRDTHAQTPFALQQHALNLALRQPETDEPEVLQTNRYTQTGPRAMQTIPSQLSPTLVPRHHQGHCPHHRSCLIQASDPPALPR